MFAEKAVSRYAQSVATFGENLKRLRERAGLTQEALAGRLHLKRPAPVSLMEGQRRGKLPKASTIVKLAAALDAEPWELLEGVEDEYDPLRKKSLSRSDLLRQAGTDDEVVSKSSTERAADDTSASARIQELEEQIRQRDALLSSIERLFTRDITTGGETTVQPSGAGNAQSRRRRVGRRTDR